MSPADDTRSYQALDSSEQAILATASRFLAAWMRAGRIQDMEAAMDKAIDLAVRMADKVDERVKGEYEL